MYQPGWTRWGGSAVLKPPGSNVALITYYSGGSAVQDFNVANDALQVMAASCLKDFEIEKEENPNFTWIGGQPPSTERIHQWDSDKIVVDFGAPTRMHDGT